MAARRQLPPASPLPSRLRPSRNPSRAAPRQAPTEASVHRLRLTICSKTDYSYSITCCFITLQEMNGNNRADWVSRNNGGRKRNQRFCLARGCVFLRSKVSNFTHAESRKSLLCSGKNRSFISTNTNSLINAV